MNLVPEKLARSPRIIPTWGLFFPSPPLFFFSETIPQFWFVWVFCGGFVTGALFPFFESRCPVSIPGFSVTTRIYFPANRHDLLPPPGFLFFFFRSIRPPTRRSSLPSMPLHFDVRMSPLLCPSPSQPRHQCTQASAC